MFIAATVTVRNAADKRKSALCRAPRISWMLANRDANA